MERGFPPPPSLESSCGFGLPGHHDAASARPPYPTDAHKVDTDESVRPACPCRSSELRRIRAGCPYAKRPTKRAPFTEKMRICTGPLSRSVYLIAVSGTERVPGHRRGDRAPTRLREVEGAA